MHESDDDEFDSYRAAPHPDDRLWRHPAEMAALAQAGQPGQPVPSADIGPEPVDEADLIEAHRGSVLAPPTRRGRALLAGALVVAVGASALSLGILSTRGDPAYVASSSIEIQSTRASLVDSKIDNPFIVGPAASEYVNQFATPQLHDVLAASLPRISVATAEGMRDGSGLFVSTDGMVATSASLIADADYILAWGHEGERWYADVVAVDWFSDVALLDVDTVSSPARFAAEVPLGTGQGALSIDHDRNSMQPGEVTAVHDALPLSEPADPASRLSVTSGILPGAAIVDGDGRVLAMVNLANPTASGLSATPAWMVQRVIGELVTDGVATHPWLGVHTQPDAGNGQVRVVSVTPESPAERSGLQPGDSIYAVADRPIDASNSLWSIVQQHRPGDTVTLSVTRSGDDLMVTAELGRLEG